MVGRDDGTTNDDRTSHVCVDWLVAIVTEGGMLRCRDAGRPRPRHPPSPRTGSLRPRCPLRTAGRRCQIGCPYSPPHGAAAGVPGSAPVAGIEAGPTAHAPAVGQLAHGDG